MNPRIGITCSHSALEIFPIKGVVSYYLPVYYVHALKKAGAVSFILPSTDTSAMESIDGLLISGGGDINPTSYGEEITTKITRLCPERDRFEIKMIKKAYKRDIPILGICRGIQMINIAFSGTLHQDIPTDIRHMQPPPVYMPTHKIECKKWLKNILGDQIMVNSFHHQCIKDLADGFEANAKSSDGIIEGIQHKNKQIYGVQFHPEWMYEKYPVFLKIFQEFVELAKKE
ncbi:MAG: gamma-glutamyl-gamma-aminobutyrate hydrolase family protein [Euryarchaeota archaeon]|nr:gamma-glutamyl-gamma-aminobutyrate hydrolase family protein [Euryarchaeota archaeon]